MKLRQEHWILLLIVLAAAIRLLPHPWNVTPIGALALFSGAFLHRQIFWLVPVAALLLGDLARTWYPAPVMLSVYAGFLASAIIGRRLLLGRVRPGRVAAATGLGALAFWLLSNLGNWWAFHPHTWQGLVTNYVNGLPFLPQSLFGDSLYVVLLFGGAALAAKLNHYEDRIPPP